MMTEVNEPTTIQVDDTKLPRTDFFDYSGSTLSADGNSSHDVVARVTVV